MIIKKTHQFIIFTILLPLIGLVHADENNQSQLGDTTTPNTVQLGYSLDHYSRTYDDNPILKLQYARATSWGSMSFLINSSKRYQSSDTQYEINAYPKLWEGGYAELNLGTSGGNLFALNSQGAEVFTSLGHSFEGSIGARHMAFSNSSVTIYTGSLSKYKGNYMLTIRPYVTPSNVGTSFSTSVKLTRYFADADEYLKVTASAGKSPEERTFPPHIVTLRSTSLGLAGQWSPHKATFVSPSYVYARQELVFAPGEYVEVDTFSVNISYRF